MTQATASKMEAYLTSRQQARRRDMLVRAIALVCVVGLIVGAGLLVRPMNKMRLTNEIVLDDKAVEGLPPDIALMTKTGTLRALAIDAAFVRLEQLKEDNRFYELMQLSDWLCKLAPRYASVWQYSAWNMAYNISVCQYTPEARWLWVSNGIENLRNRGLRFNPKSVSLYKELAWIFIHKIGDKLDDYHWAYKRELAVQMENILGEPPVVVTEDDTVREFRKIAEAPRALDAWIGSDPEAARLVADLAAVKLEPNETLLHFIASQMRTRTNTAEYAGEGAEPTAPEDLTTRRLALLRDQKRTDTIETFVAAVRAKVLREKLNMDPAWMYGLMKQYGPIDWRSPYAHSLYWATYGEHITKGLEINDPADEMNTVRFIFFSLENLARAGKIVLEPNFEQPNRSFMNMLPDLRFIRHMHEAYIKFGKQEFGDDPRYVEGTAGPNYKSGHVNFLISSIRQLYLEGGDKNIEEAKGYYFYLREYDRDENGRVKPQYDQPFEKFVFDKMYESLDTSIDARAFIGDLLRRSLENLADGDVERSVAHFNEAKKWWNYYMRDTKTDATARRKLEPIGVMRRDVTEDVMTMPPQPWGLAEGRGYSLLQKARLWRSLDLPTRQALYDKIKPAIEAFAKEHDPPLDPAKILPTPPGMEEYRKNPDRVLKELRYIDPTVSTGEKIDMK